MPWLIPFPLQAPRHRQLAVCPSLDPWLFITARSLFLASTAVAGRLFAASVQVCFATASFACLHALSSCDLRWLFRLLDHLGCESAGHFTDMAIPVEPCQRVV